mgnify:CR=1 FL=1
MFLVRQTLLIDYMIIKIVKFYLNLHLQEIYNLENQKMQLYRILFQEIIVFLRTKVLPSKNGQMLDGKILEFRFLILWP